MGFLVPAFLAALAAIGIPLLMHLRDRNEETPTRFPSLMFLVRLPIRTSDRRRVTDLPLLLLRALVVALLVVAFARPFVGRGAEVGADGRVRSVVLLLDRSMSMGHGGTWATALDSARAVVEALGADDQVALVVFDEEAELAQAWTRDKDLVRALLDGTSPVARATRFGAALRVARSALITAPPGAPEFVLVTDLQRSGLTGVAGLELPKGLPLRVVQAAHAARPNTSIRTVDARRLVDGPRMRLQVQARVLTRELAAPRTATLTLAVAGRTVATRAVTLPPSGEQLVVFDAIAAPTSAVDGVVTIDADALPQDDRFVFALPADDGITLQLVVPEDLATDETLYLERALGTGRAPAVRVEKRRDGTLDAAALDRSAAVIFWDIAPGSSDALEAFRARGAGVVILAGPRLGARRITALGDAAAVSGSADRRDGGGASFGDLRTEHPLFSPFRAAQAALGAPRYYRYTRLEPVVGAEVLARFDDGAPAVVERRVGAGRTLLLAMDFDIRRSDLPLQPAFVPLTRRLALYAGGHEAMPLARTTGESWSPGGLRREPVIVAPSGDLLRPDSGSAVVLQQVGVYTAYEGRVDGAPRARTAVNVAAAESELVTASPNELLLGVAESADSTLRGLDAPTSIDIESRQRVWRWLILLAAVLLVAESAIASQGWRGRARRATIVPPERSQG